MKIESASIVAEMTGAYLDYAAAVNLGRAIPSCQDGLKPVQRRVLFSMATQGLTADKPFRKSARITGDVMGNLHPHSSSYGTLVNLVSPDLNRHPLAEGHGNWGSLSDNAAAERYTEARLQTFASDVLLDGLDSIPTKPTYDGSATEPVTLPARLPMVMLRDTSGIGVGLACNHVSYNIDEVAEYSKAVLKGTVNKPEGALKYLQGPDLASGGVIDTASSDIETILLTGAGSLTHVAKLRVTDKHIIATELPQQVSPEKLLEQTYSAIKAEKLERSWFADVRDESDRSGIRVVWELSKKADPQLVKACLLKYTDLSKNIAVSAVSVDHTSGTVAQRSAYEAVSAWADYRLSWEITRLRQQLAKADSRWTIIQGLLVALANLDKVIKLLKADKSLTGLGLSEEQAKAIEAMPLSTLRRQNQAKLEAESKRLSEQINKYRALLNNQGKLINYICNDIDDLLKLYSSPRRTKLMKLKPLDVPEHKLPAVKAKAPEKVVVCWSRRDDGKIDVIIRKRRKSTDLCLVTDTSGYLVVTGSDGCAHQLLVKDIIKSGGKVSLTTWLRLRTRNKTVEALGLFDPASEDELTVITASGYGKKVSITELASVRKKPRPFAKEPVLFADVAEAITVCYTGGRESAMFTDEFSLQTRAAKGLKLRNEPLDRVVAGFELGAKITHRRG